MRLLLLLAATLETATPSGARAAPFDNIVTATVGWSEWCPPGIVTVDFASGHYRWFQQNRRPACSNQKATAMAEGTLDPALKEIVADAVREALSEGLTKAECRNAGKPSRMVISNSGGPYVLSIATPSRADAAPTDLGCWSPSAVRLQRMLGSYFDLPDPARRY